MSVVDQWKTFSPIVRYFQPALLQVLSAIDNEQNIFDLLLLLLLQQYCTHQGYCDM